MKALLLAIAFILAGCVRQPFDGFKALSTPRSDLRIGARWQQGIGPDGSGVADQDLAVTSSYESLSTTDEFGAKVAANIFGSLGISAEMRSKTTITIKDVQIITVANTTGVTIQPGTKMLYEAVRVGHLSLSTSSEYVSTLESALIQTLGGSSVNASANKKQATSVEAKNVFVAYRVVSFGEPRESRSTENIKGISAVSIGSYNISVRPDDAVQCACPLDPDGKMVAGRGPTPGRLAQCGFNNPLVVTVENALLGNVGSGGLRNTFEYHWHRVDQGPIVIDKRIKDGAIEVDSIRIEATLSRLIKADCLVFAENVFDEKLSNVELISVRYPIEPYPGADAAGW